MPVARPEPSPDSSRVIAHVDMDCFYVQVEQRKQPQLRGLPTAVVQYNEWKGGALIAVSYEARSCGVKRNMRGDEAKEVCPQIHLVQVPVARGKADLNAYRNAGSEVVSILSKKGRCERASIDEVYLDLTDSASALLTQSPPECWKEVNDEALKSHVLGLDIENKDDHKQKVKEWMCQSDADHRDKLLACGALIVAELRMEVLKETEFTCSAGIAHNKMLAKLASGMNKPAQQTMVPFSSVRGLLGPLPIKKMKQLGGKLGTSLQTDLGVNTVGDLLQFSEEKLQDCYGVNTGTWLWNIARGISGEEVQGRLLPKSHGSGKSFPGPRALKTIALVQHWLNQLCEELNERLYADMDQNKRIARTLTLHASAFKSGDSDSHRKFPSKSCPLRYGAVKIQEDAFNLFQAGLREYLGSYGVKTQGGHHIGWGITALSVSASKIIEIPSGTSSIMSYFSGKFGSRFSSGQTPDVTEEPTSSSHSEAKSADLEIWQNSDYTSKLQQQDNAQEDQKTHDCFAKVASSSLQSEYLFHGNSERETPSSVSQIYPQEECSTSSGHFKSKSIMANVESQKQKRNAVKNKGTILNFFKSQNSSSPLTKPGNFTSSEGFKLSGSSSKVDQVEGDPSNIDVEQRSDNHCERKEAWRYNVDEIDPTVVEELPLEIQDELRAWLRPNKQTKVIRRGSTIADYFSSTNNS